MTTHVEPKVTAQDENKLSKLKLAFLYVLIGGLAASAILAIVAILMGEFSTALQKSLWTIFIFVTHSLFILGLIWSDTHNRLGRSLIPTTLLGTALANIITTSLGTWGIIDNETAWRFVLFYFLLIGAAFIIAGTLRLKIAHKTTTLLVNVTAGTFAVWTLMMVPWVFAIVERFNPLYFRIIAALTILASTLMIITVIMRAIALARSHAAREKAKEKSHPISGGFLAYYITVGVIASFVWFGGMIGFISDGISQERYFDRESTQKDR